MNADTRAEPKLECPEDDLLKFSGVLLIDFGLGVKGLGFSGCSGFSGFSGFLGFRVFILRFRFAAEVSENKEGPLGALGICVEYEVVMEGPSSE